jgi:hypothetical protein
MPVPNRGKLWIALSTGKLHVPGIQVGRDTTYIEKKEWVAMMTGNTSKQTMFRICWNTQSSETALFPQDNKGGQRLANSHFHH